MIGPQEIKAARADGYLIYLSEGKCADHVQHTHHGQAYESYLLRSTVGAPILMGDDRWITGLGLDRELPITREQLERLINGQHAGDGTQLLKLPTEAQEATNPRTAATDFVMSMPKSISLEYFHLREIGRHDLADGLLNAVQGGVANGLGAIQEEVKMFRTGSGSGGDRVSRYGVVGAVAYLHETARPVQGNVENPHIHLHLLLPNLGLNDQGRWTHVNNYALRKSYIPLFNTLVMQSCRPWFEAHGYETEMREFHETKKPCVQFDLVHRNPEIEVQFSRRQEKIKDEIELREAQRRADLLSRLQREAIAKGSSEPERLTTAQTKRCRLRQSEIDHIKAEKEAKLAGSIEDKRDSAAEQMRAAGYQSARRENYAGPSGQAPNLPQIIIKALGRDGLTADATFFNDPDIANYTAVQAVKYNLTSGELRFVLGELRRQVVALPSSEQHDLGLFTTRTKIHEEGFADAYLDHLFGAPTAPLSTEALDKARQENIKTKGFDLSPDQLQAVEKITDGHRASILYGSAGAGKTTTLRVVNHAYEFDGFTCVGISTSNVAKKLLEEAQMPSFNAAHFIEALMSREDKPDPNRLNMPTSDGKVVIGPNTVLVLDEGSMTSSRQYHDILEIARRRGVHKITLVGDASQIPVVGRHGAFFSRVLEKALARNQVAVLTENLRQGDESFEALCSRLLRNNHTTDYLIAKQAAGQLTFVSNDDEMADESARQFLALSERHGGRDKVLLISDIHKDRIAVNEALALLNPNEPEKIEAGSESFELDGRVQFHENYKVAVARLDTEGRPVRWANRQAATRQQLVAANKEMGTVTGIRHAGTDHAELVLHMDGDSPRDIVIPVEDARECLMATSGITNHSSQGQSPEATVKQLSTNRLVGIETSYTAQSRGKQENYLVASLMWDGVVHTPTEAITHYAALMSNSHCLPTTLDYLDADDLAVVQENVRDIYALDVAPAGRDRQAPPRLTSDQLVAAYMPTASGVPGLDRRRELIASGMSETKATDAVVRELQALGQKKAAVEHAFATTPEALGRATINARRLEEQMSSSGKAPTMRDYAAARLVAIKEAIGAAVTRPAKAKRHDDDHDISRQPVITPPAPER